MSWDGDSVPAPRRTRKKAPASKSGPNSEITIRVVAGHIPAAVDQAEAALLAAGPGPIFQRAGMLVHVTTRPARRSDGSSDKQQAIGAVEEAALLEAFAKVAIFEKYDARADDWRTIDPPVKLAAAYQARARWAAPDLHQLIGTPTLRVDGTLLSRQGYDKETGLYLLAKLDNLSVPDKPTRRQADAAIGVLTGLLASFPFVQEPAGLALSVALAGLIGAVLRPTLPSCPLIGVTAPAAGTGKSYLVDLISIIATGRRAVGIATGVRPEEFEKALGAALLEGRPLLCLDNMVLPLAGQLLCMILSQERVAVRILGHSRSADVPAVAAMFATGNGLRVQGDMARRTLLCRLDAAVEHPESRCFEGDLLAEARRRRAELVGAVLTVARWHQSSRDPAPRAGKQFAGFDAWCERVRDPLLALGHTDPVEALNVTRDADLEAARLGMLIAEWWRLFSEGSRTCGNAIRAADDNLIDALVAVTGNRPDGINSRRLSNYLTRFEGRIVDGRRFQQDGKQDKAVRWKLETVENREEQDQ